MDRESIHSASPLNYGTASNTLAASKSPAPCALDVGVLFGWQALNPNIKTVSWDMLQDQLIQTEVCDQYFKYEMILLMLLESVYAR